MQALKRLHRSNDDATRMSRQASVAASQQRHDASSTDTREDACGEEHTIMTVAASGGSVGIAAYDSFSNNITVAQFVDENTGASGSGAQDAASMACPSYPVLQLIKLQLAPHTIYVSSKADGNLLEACRRRLSSSSTPIASAVDQVVDQSTSRCRIQLEHASIFHYQQAMVQLGYLQVQGMPASASPQERISYLNTLVLLREQLVSALGALLYVMQGLEFALGSCNEGHDTSDKDAVAVHVQTFTELSLKGCLMVDVATLKSLQVFVDEQHPSNMGIGKAKEGLSIYGMTHSSCATTMGKRLMRSWLLHPIVNFTVIRDRQQTVELLVNAPDTAASLKAILKKMNNVPALVQRLTGVQTKPDIQLFQVLLTSFQQLLLLRDAMSNLVADDSCMAGSSYKTPALTTSVSDASSSWGGVSISSKLLSHIPADLATCKLLIEGVVDMEGTHDEGMIIRYGVCDDLDKLKDLYHGLPDLLTEILEQELKRVPSFLARESKEQLWSILYLPLCGFVMQVSGDPLSEDLLMALPDYTLAMTGTADDGSESVYYHTDTTRELSNEVGDVLYQIRDLESTLCTKLARRLLQYAPQLQQASIAVAELDCLMAFAACARNNNYCRPSLTDENVLYIEGGRHPLAEMLVGTYIPNDTFMYDSKARVHVITGPNASGKTCYIKQVAIIAYLAHLGAWVPATKAVIGVADRIFTRLVSQESVQLQQSTFMMDLSQVAAMLNQSTDRSIIIIDEFGKGTNTAGGVGLLAAMLQHYASMRSPLRCLASTHFAELFDPDVLPRNEQLAMYTMDVMDSGTGIADDTESIFLFRLVPGRQGPCFGLHCAKMCGLPADVLARASEVLVSQEGTATLEGSSNAGKDFNLRVALVQQLQELDLSAAQWRESAASLLADCVRPATCSG